MQLPGHATRLPRHNPVHPLTPAAHTTSLPHAGTSFNLSSFLEKDHKLMVSGWQALAAAEAKYCKPSHVVPAVSYPPGCSVSWGGSGAAVDHWSWPLTCSTPLPTHPHLTPPHTHTLGEGGVGARTPSNELGGADSDSPAGIEPTSTACLPACPHPQGPDLNLTISGGWCQFNKNNTVTCRRPTVVLTSTPKRCYLGFTTPSIVVVSWWPGPASCQPCHLL